MQTNHRPIDPAPCVWCLKRSWVRQSGVSAEGNRIGPHPVLGNAYIGSSFHGIRISRIPRLNSYRLSRSIRIQPASSASLARFSLHPSIRYRSLDFSGTCPSQRTWIVDCPLRSALARRLDGQSMRGVRSGGGCRDSNKDPACGDDASHAYLRHRETRRAEPKRVREVYRVAPRITVEVEPTRQPNRVRLRGRTLTRIVRPPRREPQPLRKRAPRRSAPGLPGASHLARFIPDQSDSRVHRVRRISGRPDSPQGCPVA